MWAVYVGECGRMCVDVGGIYGWMWVDVILSLFLAFFLSLPLLFDTCRFLFKTLSSIMGNLCRDPLREMVAHESIDSSQPSLLQLLYLAFVFGFLFVFAAFL